LLLLLLAPSQCCPTVLGAPCATPQPSPKLLWALPQVGWGWRGCPPPHGSLPPLLGCKPGRAGSTKGLVCGVHGMWRSGPPCLVPRPLPWGKPKKQPHRAPQLHGGIHIPTEPDCSPVRNSPQPPRSLSPRAGGAWGHA